MSIPTETLKPKVALMRDGKVPTKLGRGRMNQAQKDRIAELVNAGWRIEGYGKAPVKATASTSEPVAPKVVRTAGPAEKQVIEPKAEVRKRDTFKAMTTVNQKQVPLPGGNLTVCDNCGNSFTHCNCGNPTAMVEGRSRAVWFV